MIFETIWKEGLALDSDEAIQKLESELKVQNLGEMINDQRVKDQLRKNTELAAQMSVFGVPTFIAQNAPNELFWGMDSLDMLLDFINDPDAYNDDEMRRYQHLPVGVQRKR